MHNFKYAAPGDLKEAVSLKAAHKSAARLMAGGTDLLIFMRAGRQRPDWVIDVKGIPELTAIAFDKAGELLVFDSAPEGFCISAGSLQMASWG